MIVRSLQLHKSVKESRYRGATVNQNKPQCLHKQELSWFFPSFSFGMSVKFLTVMKAVDEMHPLWDFMQD